MIYCQGRPSKQQKQLNSSRGIKVNEIKVFQWKREEEGHKALYQSKNPCKQSGFFGSSKRKEASFKLTAKSGNTSRSACVQSKWNRVPDSRRLVGNYISCFIIQGHTGKVDSIVTGKTFPPTQGQQWRAIKIGPAGQAWPAGKGFETAELAEDRELVWLATLCRGRSNYEQKGLQTDRNGRCDAEDLPISRKLKIMMIIKMYYCK